MRVLLIGGSKGIGQAVYDRLKPHHEIRSLSRSSTPPLDLAWDESLIADPVHKSIEDLGGLDWLIVSSGMGAYMACYEPTPKSSEMMQVNFLGPRSVFKAAHRDLLRSRGKALFIGSSVAWSGARGLQDYAATKGAMHSWVVSLARGFAKHHVAVNVLAPGWVETPMTDGISPHLKESILKSLPMRRMIWPAEVAVMVELLLQAPHVLTGQVIPMTGGA